MASYTKENFPYAEYYKTNKAGINSYDGKQGEKDKLYDAYVKAGANWVGSTGTPAATPAPTTITGNDPGNVQVVAGTPKAGTNQINVADYGSNLVTEPELALQKETTLSNKVPTMTGTEAGTNISKSGYQMDENALNQTASQATASQAAGVKPQDAQTYEAQQTQGQVAQNDMTAVQGQVSDKALIKDVPQIDINSIANGLNPLGEALNAHAEQKLEEVSPLATAKGQLELLQQDFTGPNGEPKIPIWAQGTAREVSKIAAFGGMTGSAATAAMATAMMEASLPIAQADATFFQTLTVKNLDNKQASIINKANVLANMELANQDARVTAAVQNSQAFLQMDMKNLDNRQQAAVINNQNRVQSILEDAKAVNTQRMFTAQSQNDMNKFYDELNSQINQFNTSQVNNMKQFNTDQTNSMKKYNADLENQREQFEKTMSYNIDVSNAKWRQTVTMQNADYKFQAAATDVKNMVDISSEQLNRLWNRADSVLQYLWQSGENEADRKANMALAKYQASQASKNADKAGLGAVFGTVAGSIAGSDKFLDWLF